MPEPGTWWPLTAAQHGIWTGQQLDPRSPAYNTAEYVEIHGGIRVDVLVAAIRRTVAETEALTVRFAEHDGVPRQVVDPPDWEVWTADLRDEPDPLGAAEGWMAEDTARPVDLGTDVLFGHAVFRIGDDRFLWYHRVHHILLDGYGLALVARRVAEVYTALARDRAPAEHGFGALRSVVDHDADYEGSALCERDRDFWVAYQADRPDPVSLAGRTAPLARHVTREFADLDRPVVDLLHRVATAARATWTDVLIAAISAYLHRMTGAEQVSLALPVMLRTGSPALRVPCMVLNVVQLWSDFADDPSLDAVTAQVSGHLRRGRKHHRYRYEQLRRDLRMVGSDRKLFGPSANIMPFDYGLTFDGHPSVVRNVSAGLVEDLAVNVYDRADGAGLRVAFDGNPNLYTGADLATHLRRFSTFLHRLLRAPGTPVGEVDVLVDDERRTLLHDWNDTDRTWPESTIPDLLSECAARQPNTTALVAWDRAGPCTPIDHATLGARVNRLAWLLRGHGVGPGSVVMLLLPRTTDAVVALFAVLRAGAAYLPADPDHPRARLGFLLDDARPHLVLTTAALAPGLPGTAVPTVELDAPETARAVAAQPDSAPEHGIGPDDPLCLIHTSGSTGRPKGAVLTHRSMVNLFHHHRTEMIEPETAAAGRDRLAVALTASLSFDTSWEGLLWLLAGHELHFIDDDVRREPAELLRHVRANRIDFLDITPTYAEELLAAGLLDPGEHRPAVLALGGEAAGPALWSALRAVPEISAYNLYGPTECTVDTVWARLRDSETPIIGRPVANGRCHVLDGASRLLPPGAVGELHLGGAPVSRGYHDRPGLTAERFVPDPFGPPGSTLYRTGDLARWRSDGTLEYLGRADDQVKVRGFRIEPGEVEATLGAHPDLAQVAVVVRADRLVAYVVPLPGATPPDQVALRRFAAERLPDYMVPPVYVLLERLPVNTNGKLDRGALPAPPSGSPGGGRAPATERERALCGLFADALGVAEVGVDDDFFALGGHSLLAARLLAGVRAEFGVRLGIRDVFDAPTPAALGTRMDTVEPTATHPWAGIDLATEVALPAAVRPAPASRAGPPRSVLLTGATGFLGAFLLRELLGRTGARVHCLVRADDEQAAINRVRRALNRHGLGEHDLDRVVAVPGDLARPALGLTPETFLRLAAEVDVVLHNGARVNHLEPYARLRAANVRGTAEVLRLACAHRSVPVHFVSTCDTAVAVDGNPPVLGEDRRVPAESLSANGYVGSKWVAEGMVLAAGERGLPVCVHRPSRIGGHSATGAGSTDDAFWTLVRAMLVLGAAPDADEPPGFVDIVPVDWVAAVVVRVLLVGRTGRTHHLTSPRPLAVATVLARLRARGHRLEPLPAAAWAARLAEAADAAADRGDHTLAVAATHTRGPAGAAGSVVFGRDNALAVSTGADLPPAEVDDTVLDAYLDHFTEVGFFPDPAVRSAV
ncbi:amino acid adenylation domain-containing protein [Actinokineospora sp. PR83]|uniref:SDR family oxidoreductase n=1 Tax=Actinokineospora sp. PR83 TaxID=2884908 RepID=UPI001F29A319|nr:SDR family oxidoreductase [Actinokineospora sp. PR83]MCG8914475.1 amino acid adenylation domain-containing protein [Actinokineospora sp. PR83]